MTIFQLIFVLLLVLEIMVGIAVKYNCYNLQDRLINLYHRMDIDDFIRNKFADRWIIQMVFMLVLLILCIC